MRHVALTLLLTTAFVGNLAANNPLEQLVKDELNLSEFTVQELVVPTNPSGPVAIVVKLGTDNVGLVLDPHSLRSDHFELFVEDQTGNVTHLDAPPIHTYRGDAALLVGTETTLGSVRASIRDGSFWATIRLPNGASYGIQPLREVVPVVGPSTHVVYNLDDFVPDPSWNCVSVTPPGIGVKPSTVQPPILTLGTPYRVCEVGIEADFLFYQQNQSSVTTTVFDIENVMNSVEGIYENDLDITYELTSFVIRTSSAEDPYTTTDSSGLLSQFRSHWESTKGSVQRDVAHLFTGRNLNGSTGPDAGVIGVAYNPGICTSSSAYGLSQSKFSGNFSSRVGLTAHELGHNWDANHCSGSDCRIMCPSIGGCAGDVSKFGAASKAAITNYKNAIQNCLSILQSPVALPFNETFPSVAFNTSNWSHIDGALINTNATSEPSAPNSLNLDASGASEFQDDEVRTNFILAQGANNLQVKYSTEHIGVESGEELVVEYWNNNKTWVELNRVTSNGSNQTSFVAHTHTLPANGYHNELRLRFRAEVNASNDEWYIDNISIDSPAALPPVLSSISPSPLPVLPQPNVMLSGSGFSGATLVSFGGALLTAGMFTVVNDTTITLPAPTLATLGSKSVFVATGAGVSNTLNFNYVKADPPALSSPLFAFNGSPLGLDWAGDPFDSAFLVVNFDGSSFPIGGMSFLNPTIFLPVLPLNTIGAGGINPTVNGAPAATVLHLQVWMLDPGATTTASLKGTNISNVTILF